MANESEINAESHWWSLFALYPSAISRSDPYNISWRRTRMYILHGIFWVVWCKIRTWTQLTGHRCLHNDNCVDHSVALQEDEKEDKSVSVAD